MVNININLDVDYPDDASIDAIKIHIEALFLNNAICQLKHMYIFPMDTRKGEGFDVE